MNHNSLASEWNWIKSMNFSLIAICSSIVETFLFLLIKWSLKWHSFSWRSEVNSVQNMPNPIFMYKIASNTETPANNVVDWIKNLNKYPFSVLESNGYLRNIKMWSYSEMLELLRFDHDSMKYKMIIYLQSRIGLSKWIFWMI